MKFCEKCGNQMDDRAVMCPNCRNFITGYGEKPKPKDSGSIGWFFFGLFPLGTLVFITLVIYLVWKTDRPKTARKILMGLRIQMGVYILLFALYYFWMIFYMYIKIKHPYMGPTSGDWI